MKTAFRRLCRRTDCRLFCNRNRARTTALAAIVSGFLLAGCATDHRYLARKLPPDLQAPQWQALCAVDLSHSVAESHPPKFDFGDEVEIVLATGLKSTETTRLQATVDRDGTVELPVLGRIPLVNTTPDAARDAVVHACHQRWPQPGTRQTPLVQVTLKQPRQHRITVTGAVEHPGIITLPRQESDLVFALAAAGGISRDAGTKIIIQSRGAAKDSIGPEEVRTVGSRSETFQPTPLAQIEERPGKRREVQLPADDKKSLAREELQDGDVVMVERRDPPSVVVTGMVQQPGRYNFPVGQDFRVLDAVSSAHGVTYKVIDHVHVCRAIPGRPERAVIQVSLREATRSEAENIRLMAGDIVSVEANMSVLFQDTIDFIEYALIGAAPVVVR
jgi:polysaccharide biosynthesis/export protein